MVLVGLSICTVPRVSSDEMGYISPFFCKIGVIFGGLGVFALSGKHCHQVGGLLRVAYQSLFAALHLCPMGEQVSVLGLCEEIVGDGHCLHLHACGHREGGCGVVFVVVVAFGRLHILICHIHFALACGQWLSGNLVIECWSGAPSQCGCEGKEQCE